MSASDFVHVVMDMYGTLIAYSLPVAAFIGACNIGINIISNAFFGGRLKIGGGRGD